MSGAKLDSQFLTIRNAAKKTGLSEKYLRSAVKAKQVPFVMSGNRHYIDMKLFDQTSSTAPGEQVTQPTGTMRKAHQSKDDCFEGDDSFQRLDELPVGANPCCFWRDRERCFINPMDKYERKKRLTSKEYDAFSSICSLGPNQIISCYQSENRTCSPTDIADACSNCPYAVQQTSLNRIRFANQDTVADAYDNSIWKPHFVVRLLTANGYWNCGDVLDRDTGAYVYYIDDGRYIKIGKATDPWKRLKEIQTGNPTPCRILCAIPCKNEEAAANLERNLHHIYSEYRMNGEWFDIREKLVMLSFREMFNPDCYKGMGDKQGNETPV